MIRFTEHNAEMSAFGTKRTCRPIGSSGNAVSLVKFVHGAVLVSSATGHRQLGKPLCRVECAQCGQFYTDTPLPWVLALFLLVGLRLQEGRSHGV